MSRRVDAYWSALFTEEGFKGMFERHASLRACLRVGSDGSSVLSLLLTLDCVLNFAWRDVRILSVPLFADGEVKCD